MTQVILDELLTKLTRIPVKKSFLVFKFQKYFTIPTSDIAFFYLKFGNTVIKCFDGNEYGVKYSLEEIQSMVTDKQFFRVNRQYLVNFDAIKETEHYFARKLLIKAKVATQDKLLISKEKVTMFLHWLENR